MKYFFEFNLKTTTPFVLKKIFSQKWLVKRRNLSEGKNNPPVLKYSVTFVTKVQTKTRKNSKSLRSESIYSSLSCVGTFLSDKLHNITTLL